MAEKKTIEFDNDELLAFAKQDISKGDNEQALLKIKKVLASKKPDDEAYSMAAKIYAQLQLHERAQEMFQKYLKNNPEATVENFQLGMTYFDSGNRGEALKIWSGILQKSPTNPPALFYTALASGQEGDTTAAKQALDTLLKSVPADNLYFNQGKQLLSAIERGDQAQVSSAGDDSSDAASSNFLLKNAYGTEH